VFEKKLYSSSLLFLNFARSDSAITLRIKSPGFIFDFKIEFDLIE